jgi:hypothetical protein
MPSVTQRAPSSNISGSDPTNPPGQMVHVGVFANTFRRPSLPPPTRWASSVHSARLKCRRRPDGASARVVGTRAVTEHPVDETHVRSLLPCVSLPRPLATPVKWSPGRLIGNARVRLQERGSRVQLASSSSSGVSVGARRGSTHAAEHRSLRRRRRSRTTTPRLRTATRPADVAG